MKEKKEKKEKKELNKKVSKHARIPIKSISASKLLKSFSRTNYGVVKEAPERVYADDNRSLFFKEEWNREQRNIRRS